MTKKQNKTIVIQGSGIYGGGGIGKKTMKEFVKFNRKFRLKQPLKIRDISEVSIKNRKFSRFAEGDADFKEGQEDFRKLIKK